jgi:hypothetical protein
MRKEEIYIKPIPVKVFTVKGKIVSIKKRKCKIPNLYDNLDKFYTIKSDLLDIIGTGLTQKEAEENFAEEFDYIYKTYNSLTKNQLSERLIRIKKILNLLINKIE